MRGSGKPAQLAARTRDTRLDRLMGMKAPGSLETGKHLWAPHCLPSPWSECPHACLKSSVTVSQRRRSLCRGHCQGGGKTSARRRCRKPGRPPGGSAIRSLRLGRGLGKTPRFQFTRRLPLPFSNPVLGTRLPHPPTPAPSPSTLACDHTDCFKHLLRVAGPSYQAMVGALINLFYFISHPLTEGLRRGVCRYMQITCKLPTGAKCLGPFNSVAGLR